MRSSILESCFVCVCVFVNTLYEVAACCCSHLLLTKHTRDDGERILVENISLT